MLYFAVHDLRLDLDHALFVYPLSIIMLMLNEKSLIENPNAFSLDDKLTADTYFKK